MTATYEIISCDVNGANQVGHPGARATAPCRDELNRAGSFTFTVPVTDPAPDGCKPLREVQVWRYLGVGSPVLVWWGVITRRTRNNLHEWECEASGLLWYFSKRFFGRAGRTNLLLNGSFESGLTGWINGGVSATIVNQWGAGGNQVTLYQGGSGTDTFIAQNVSVAGGNYLTLAAWFQIRTDAQWVGPAIDGRGLYIERLGGDGATVEDVQFFAITDDTPRGTFQRATVNIWSPPGGPWTFRVRLYSTLCTNPTPTGGRPPGGIIWDDVQLVLMESLSFPYNDLGNIINGIVAHAQDAAYGKSSLNITPGAGTTGNYLDRTYQHADHRNILEALQEFSDLDFCNFAINWNTAGTTRTLNVGIPPDVPRTDVLLELDKAGSITGVSTIEEDGGSVVTSSTYLGDGAGPERDEAGYIDTSRAGGLVLEEVTTAENSTHHDLLPGLAKQRVQRKGAVIQVPQIQVAPELIGVLHVNDVVPIEILPAGISANYKIVATELDTISDTLSLTVNPV